MTYKCEKTVDEWQLYSFTAEEIAEGKPDPEVAVREINAALTCAIRKAKARLAADPCLSERKLAYKIQEEIYKVMEKHDSAGACDSEPENVLCEELEQAFGLEVYSVNR